MGRHKQPVVPIPIEPEIQPEIKRQIIERLSEGETLRSICRSEGFPSWNSIYQWMDKDKDFNSRVARARILGYDALAEECIQIANDGSNDTYVDDNGNRRVDQDVVQRSKLRIETRLKLLACWHSSRYGEKVAMEHSGQIDHTITLSEDARLAMIERRKAIREKIEHGKVIDITATSERRDAEGA